MDNIKHRRLNISDSQESLMGVKRKRVDITPLKMNPNTIARPRHLSMKEKNKPVWNDRFSVDSVCNYTSLHPYFKVF